MIDKEVPPLVSIFMVTYNHEKYIAQAIESIMMQEVDFSFKLIIGEDCSTDKTLSICKLYKEKYPDKIELITYDTNVGSSRNVANVYRRCIDIGAKYVAILEGDDYWVDKFKLKKQIAALQENEDCSFCFTNVDHLFGKTGDFKLKVIQKESGVKIDIDSFLISGCYIPTLTVMFKANCYPNQMPSWFLNVIKQDWFVFLCLFKKGKAIYLNNVTGVYRIHQGGIMHTPKIKLISNNLFLTKNTRDFLYPEYQDLFTNNILSNTCELAFAYLENKEVNGFLKNINKAIEIGEKKSLKWYWLLFKRFVRTLRKLLFT